MSEDGPPDREGALDAALAAHGDYRTDGFQALDDARKSPLDALLAKEDYKGDEALLDWIDDATVDAIAHRFEAEVHGARLEAFRRLIEFLFDGGRVKTPRDACIRLYSVAKGITPDLSCLRTTAWRSWGSCLERGRISGRPGRPGSSGR